MSAHPLTFEGFCTCYIKGEMQICFGAKARTNCRRLRTEETKK